MRTRLLAATAIAAATTVCAATLSGCGSGSGSSSKTIKVVYQQQLNNNNKVQAGFLDPMVKQFEKANPGTTVKLVPVTASENDYYTKIQLMMRSPRPRPTWSTRTPRPSTPMWRAAISSPSTAI